MPRNFSTIPTCRWQSPMRFSTPDQYGRMLQNAPDEKIEYENLLQFTKEKPGIDTRCDNAEKASSISYFKKMITLNQLMSEKQIPSGFKPCPMFNFFHNFVRGHPLWKRRVAFEGDVVIVSLKTNLYELWDAADDWLKFRQSQTNTKCDNGWYRHAIRLAARYQWWRLTGAENWHRGEAETRDRVKLSLERKERMNQELREMREDREEEEEEERREKALQQREKRRQAAKKMAKEIQDGDEEDRVSTVSTVSTTGMRRRTSKRMATRHTFYFAEVTLKDCPEYAPLWKMSRLDVLGWESSGFLWKFGFTEQDEEMIRMWQLTTRNGALHTAKLVLFFDEARQMRDFERHMLQRYESSLCTNHSDKMFGSLSREHFYRAYREGETRESVREEIEKDTLSQYELFVKEEADDHQA